ncbi:MAG: hypothetical protein IJZ85_04305 [Lachnospiraceae bacterium]|nr:hypothetical protein [Lachnospiraceae bacterium]
MWKAFKTKLAEKIDIKITGYISAFMFGLTVIGLFMLIGMAAGTSGELPLWAAFAGVGIIVFNGLAIRLSKWGQAQTGRRLKINKVAVWMNRGMIGVMILIYGLGVVLSM